jgi:hypothetical protein
MLKQGHKLSYQDLGLMKIRNYSLKLGALIFGIYHPALWKEMESGQRRGST